MALAGSTLDVSQMELKRTLNQISKFAMLCVSLAHSFNNALTTFVIMLCGMVGLKCLFALWDKLALTKHLFFLLFFFL